MSIKVSSQVWEGLPKAGSELLTMLALADWADDNGRCFPAMETIAKKIRLSRSQAQRITHKLIEDGYLSVTGNSTGGPPGSSRRYQINLEALTTRTDDAGSVHATGGTETQEGPHECAERGCMDATRIINKPSVNHPGVRASKGIRRVKSTETPCPKDFSVSKEMLQWAIDKGVPESRIAMETEKFIHWHTSKGRTFANWNAAWRTWMIRCIDPSSDKRGNTPTFELSKQQYREGEGVNGHL